jgi:hypothetical protein
VVGAWVKDGKKPSHGWNELHPVWKLAHAGKTLVSAPQFGGDPTEPEAPMQRLAAGPRPASAALVIRLGPAASNDSRVRTVRVD